MFKKFNFKSLLISLIGMLLMLFVLPVGAFAAEGDVEINDTNFPDPIFQSYVRSLPGGFDGILTPEDIEGITEISLFMNNASDLKGIEHFTALKKLSCFDCQSLSSLDLSKNTALVELQCSNSNITTLNLSNNSNLTTLTVSSKNLNDLDLANCPKLTTLNCTYTNLTTLDLSNNPNLKELICYQNKLTAIDLKSNSALSKLECYGNQLTSLDLSSLNNLKTLSVDNNQLTSIDVSNCPLLTDLGCSTNQFETIDLSANPDLNSLFCEKNHIKSLDLSKNKKLTNLYCSHNQLSSLDLSNNPNLMYIECTNNNLTSIDVSQCQNLENLKVTSNPIPFIDVSNNPALGYFYCSDTPLIALDVSKNTSLKVLAVGNHVRDMEDGTPLSSLQGFDKTKVSDLNGGNFDNDCINFTGNTITYSYDTGKADSPLKVTLNKLEHVHQTTLVNGQAPTATQDGWKDYYSCICGKNFEDAAATVEIVELEIWKANDGKLPATGEPSGGEEPEIIEGQNSEWTADSNEALSFRSSADFSEFLHVLVDGIIVDPANYTLREGSIIVTFKPEYLKTLSVGKHSISIVATSGTASTNFMITETPSGSGSGSTTDQTTVTVPANGTTSPATGLQNHSGNTVLIVLFVLVCLGLAGTMVYRVKKNR